MIFQKIFLLSILLFSSTVIIAATDGIYTKGLHSSSVGTLGITALKMDAAHISKLSDMVVSNSGKGNADVTVSHSICHFATTANYKIDISTVNGFQLVHPGSNPKKMNYTIEWDDNKNGSIDWIFTDTPSSAMSHVFLNNNKTSDSCNNSTNTTLTVRITDAQYRNKPVNVYTDIVTLIISTQ